MEAKFTSPGVGDGEAGLIEVRRRVRLNDEREVEDGAIMPRVVWRMLVLAALVFASGFALRVAWESFDEPREAEAQSPAEGDRYDCDDFATPAQAQGILQRIAMTVRRVS